MTTTPAELLRQAREHLRSQARHEAIERYTLATSRAAFIEGAEWAVRAAIDALPSAPAWPCHCDERGIGKPGVTCGDCPRDYGHTVDSAPSGEPADTLRRSLGRHPRHPGTQGAAMNIDNGGPAFPAPDLGEQDFGQRGIYSGMTLRDYLAAHAPSPPADFMRLETEYSDSLAYTVRWRWAYADAMLKARAAKAAEGGE